jgi:putative ABC transport system permease protein
MDPNSVFSIEGGVRDLVDGAWEPIPVTMRDPETGEEHSFRVIGVVDSPVASGIVPAWVAVFVPEASALGFLDDPGQAFFLDAVGGTEEAVTVANGIESTLLDQGVQADSLQELIDESTAQQGAFSMLFVGFMSLGLVVGIAALGVIAFRTVAERRQQIGMLRAIGYSRRLVAISFFLESSFIAVAGIGMGLVLGGALSYNLMTSPEFTNGQAIDFSYPVRTILIIVGIAYFATAVMTLIPARSASRVPVAEALRYSA